MWHLALLLACTSPKDTSTVDTAPLKDTAQDTAPPCTGYSDTDGDGFGDPSVPCGDSAVSSFTDDNSDCDDANPQVNPAADERCDEIDNDCDEEVDEGSAIDAVAWFPDEDNDGYGEETSSTTSCDPVSGHVEIGGDCDDNDPSTHPNAEEICGDGRDTDCDGLDEGCWLLGDFTPDDADAVIAGSTSLLGWNRGASFPDVSGDELNDLFFLDASGGWLLSAPFEPWATLEENSVAQVPAASLGFTGGDIDGDGAGDLIVELYDGITRASVFLGPVSGELTPEIADFEIAQSTAEPIFSPRQVLVMDFDGDDASDLVVSSPHYSDDHPKEGAVAIFDGPMNESAQPEDAPIWIAGGRHQEMLGDALSGADLDGDGWNDLLLGAPISLYGAYWGCAAYIFYGPLSGVYQSSDPGTGALLDADVRYTSVAWDGLGGDLDARGDLDGDGLSDVVLGAHEPVYDNIGAVHVCFSAAQGEVDPKIDCALHLEGREPHEGFGGEMESGGDLDDDGHDDLILSVGVGAEPTGATYVLYGPLSAGSFVIDEVADVTIRGAVGEGSVDNLSTVVFGGDLNGDGLDDLATAAINADEATVDGGAVYLFFGGLHPL